MNAIQFFLEQYNTVRGIADGMVYANLSDDQLRHQPQADQNSLAWLLWHASRGEDFAVTVLDPAHTQVLNQDDWQARLNLTRCDVGTAMTAEECVAFNVGVDITGLRTYWAAVGQRTQAVVATMQPEALDEAVD
jgi:hypothetical protein